MKQAKTAALWSPEARHYVLTLAPCDVTHGEGLTSGSLTRTDDLLIGSNLSLLILLCVHVLISMVQCCVVGCKNDSWKHVERKISFDQFPVVIRPEKMGSYHRPGKLAWLGRQIHSSLLWSLWNRLFREKLTGRPKVEYVLYFSAWIQL